LVLSSFLFQFLQTGAALHAADDGAHPRVLLAWSDARGKGKKKSKHGLTSVAATQWHALMSLPLAALSPHPLAGEGGLIHASS